MRRCGTLLTLLLFTLAVGGTSHAASNYVTLEKGIKRSGPQYRSVSLKKDSPELCQQACAEDGECQAYTYAKPGVQGPRASCLLIKGRIASTERNDCCVSGVKRTRSPAATSSPSVSGPVAKMAAPPAKGSQATPKVLADRFSPGPSSTKPPPVVKGDEVIYRRKPFLADARVEIEKGDSSGLKSITIPDEYLLVIETISVSCHFGTKQHPESFFIQTGLKDIQVIDTTGIVDDFASIYIPLSKQGENITYYKPYSLWIGTQQVRTYAAPGTKVLVWVNSNTDDTSASTSCSCSLSGYLLDPDSPSLAP